MTPADASFGRAQAIIKQRKRIKQHNRTAALATPQTGRLTSTNKEDDTLLIQAANCDKCSDDGHAKKGSNHESVFETYSDCL